jgi:MFS family permease
MTPYYAFIPILYPDNVEFAIGLAEIFTGGGFMVGPAVGSLLYSLGGYTTPFIVFGSSTLVVAPIAYFIIKRSGQEKVEVLLPEG